MQCITFVRLVVTDQIGRLTLLGRVQARMHCMVCCKCRGFNHNNEVLNNMLLKYIANKPKV